MLNRERFFVKSDFIEDHSYFPEVDKLHIKFECNSRVKLFGSKIINVDFVFVDAKYGLNDDIFLHDDMFGSEGAIYLVFCIDDSH